jgi:membrane-associated phospholipid phosphatase
MIAVWVTLAGFLVVETVWLSLSRLHFAESNWPGLIHVVLFTAIGLGMCALVSHRLSGVTDRVGLALRGGTHRVELFAIAALITTLLSAVIVTYCYLGTAAALPLQDARLSRIDHWLGFGWVGFVEFVNSSALASRLLVEGYRSTPYVLIGTVLWLCFTGQGNRLAEFLALMCLTSIGIAIGMMILPAEGAYAYYNPPLSIYDNIGAGSGMWHHPLLMALRTGTDTLIDFSTPNSSCLVTFPSGHTILAVIMTYALRESKWTLIPAVIINTTMLVSTIPHGGHHLTDLIAGGAIALCAIFLVRLPLGVLRERPVASGHVVLADA